jgi:predicted RNA-binding Zn ribbon-like protein
VSLEPASRPPTAGAEADPDTGTKPPAPGQLALVQAFVNTNNLERERDRFATPSQLRAWLVEHHLLDPAATVDEADCRRTLGVREALRALLLANNGAPYDAETTEVLNRAARRARLVVSFDESGRATLEPAAPDVDGALGKLLAGVYTTMAEGTWHRLKACRDDACQWAFYDASKNRSGAWCTMAECGNRAKARAYRERKKVEVRSEK